MSFLIGLVIGIPLGWFGYSFYLKRKQTPPAF